MLNLSQKFAYVRKKSYLCTVIKKLTVMKTSTYSTKHLLSKISFSKEFSFFSGKPYVYSMRYRGRLIRWRDDSARLYDIVSDPHSAEVYPIAYNAALNFIYDRLVDIYYDTLPSKL